MISFVTCLILYRGPHQPCGAVHFSFCEVEEETRQCERGGDVEKFVGKGFLGFFLCVNMFSTLFFFFFLNIFFLGIVVPMLNNIYLHKLYHWMKGNLI